MKTISSWRHLEKFGIDCLTSESCGLNYRVLCDVTAKGRKIILRMLDVPDISLSAPWNRGTDKDPHLGSLLLSPSMLAPLAVFALLENGAKELWVYKTGAVVGIFPEDSADDIATMELFSRGDIDRKLTVQGTAGDRNLHLFTGRTA